ncbi:MAG: exopolyphosphatase [Tissierellia bacterium]|nr:exopolyphosphatase [Tissierellia bacterium]
MIHGIIDIGSNTIRLSVFAVEGRQVSNLFNEKATVGLGSYREKGAITPEGIKKLICTLQNFLSITDNFGDIEEVHAFATASIRNVNNTEEVLAEVKEATGLAIELLSGSEEARLAFMGAGQTLDEEELASGILTDIGGGSTEIVFFHNRKIVDSFSLDLGSLTAYKDYACGLFLTSEERKAVDGRLKELLSLGKMPRDYFDVLCAVGGSARAILKYYNEYFDEHPDNRTMNPDDLKAIMKELLDLDYKEKMNRILKIKADRIHTFLPGMTILYRIAKYYHVHTISVSQTGIREGYVYDRLVGGAE